MNSGRSASTECLGDSEKDAILELYRQTNADRKDFTDRQWETLRYVLTIFSGLMALSVGLLTVYIQPTIVSVPKYASETLRIGEISVPLLKLLIIFVLVFNLLMVCLCHLNLRREYKRAIEKIAQMKKIETYLGLWKTVPNHKRLFPNNNYIILDRHFGRDCKNTDQQWVESKMTWRPGSETALKNFNNLFYLYVVSIFVLLVLTALR